ncbi:hypothetical protein MRX96_046660 [Rhipicephalus microplus]
MEYPCVVDMDSPSTRSAELGGCDDGLEHARSIGLTQKSDSTVAINSNRNGTTEEQAIAAPRRRDATPRPRRMTAAECYSYAHTLHQICPILPPATLIMEHIDELLAELENAHVDMQMPCTMTDTEPCWVVNNLRTLNQSLVRANIEILEMEPRRLLVRNTDLDERHSEFNGSTTLKACILLDLLFKGHRCIHELRLRPQIVDTWSAQILSVSLASNTSIKHVTTEGLCSRLYAPGHPLMDSICEMPSSLESLCITGLYLGSVTVERLGAMMEKMKSLRSVKFVKNDMPPGAGKELMRGMCKNNNLETVSLSHVAMGRSGARALGDYLATHSKLRELSLASLKKFGQEQVVSIAEGLKNNHGLQILKIEGLHVDPGSIGSFAETLTRHSSLKYLTVTGCSLAEVDTKYFAVFLKFNTRLLALDLSGNNIDDIGANDIARMLKFNRSLQKLDLSKNSVTYRGAVPLVEALASNGVLKELALWGVSDDEKERPLASALSRNRAHGRVLVSHDSVESVFQLAKGVLANTHLIRTLHLDASVHVNTYCTKTLFLSLAAIPFLKSLNLECETSFNRCAAENFAELLFQTRELEHVQISHCYMNLVALQIVMNALAENESVLDMNLGLGVQSFSGTRAIVDMLKRNSTILHFGNFTVRTCELQFLAYQLRSNPVLRTLNISALYHFFEKPVVEGITFEISEVLRRNMRYCHRAVQSATKERKLGTRREPAVGENGARVPLQVLPPSTADTNALIV